MIKYKQISLEEREKIYTLSKNGVPVIKIALELNRHKSTIYGYSPTLVKKATCKIFETL